VPVICVPALAESAAVLRFLKATGTLILGPAASIVKYAKCRCGSVLCPALPTEAIY